MDQRKQLVELFEEMVILLELAGENPFKARAIQKAARILHESSQPLQSILAEPPAGFGKGLLEKVHEFIQSNRLSELETLRAKFPPSLFELLKVQGLGPKKVKALYETLNISRLEDLEQACRQEKIRELPGFGAKTETNILAGIEVVKTFRGQFLLAEVDQIGRSFVDFLQRRFPGQDVFIAGSCRRRKELVKDLDLLVPADSPLPIMKAFVAYPDCRQILAEGETKSSILLTNGLQVDLRVIPPDSLGPALCHFTGSKEHNVRMRQIAGERGLKLNEYGLFRGEVAEPMATEESVFSALGLAFIPPELREDLGEMEWAQARTIPPLVTFEQLRGALHVHTHFSDGTASLADMAEAAQRRGWQWLGITDHSRSSTIAGGMSVEKVLEQQIAIDRLNSQLQPFRLLKGIECDLLADGTLDYPPEILERFDFVLVSAHSHLGLSSEETTRRFLRAIANPFCDILGHLSGRILLDRPASEFDADAVLNACSKSQVAVEINSNPHRLDLDWRLVRRFRTSGLNFLLSPDAHSPEGLDDIHYGVSMARKGALSPSVILNTLTAEEFLQRIRQRRSR